MSGAVDPGKFRSVDRSAETVCRGRNRYFICADLYRKQNKIKEYGLEDHLEEMNRKLVALSKEAAKGTNALVAGDLTMTGEQLYPLGDLMFEDLVDVYKEQAKIIAEAGADLFVVETMMSLQECRAAVLAIREVCDLPVMVSLTYNEDGRTLYGTDPVTAVVVMQSLGADAVGMNCSTGPEAMLEPIAKMAEYATIPLLAKPNAGMPELIDGQTVFNVEPEEFAEVGKNWSKRVLPSLEDAVEQHRSTSVL